MPNTKTATTSKPSMKPSFGLLEQIEKSIQEIQSKMADLGRAIHNTERAVRQILRDIAQVQSRREELLEQYRDQICDGDKDGADTTLEQVAEQRKRAEALWATLQKNLSTADKLDRQRNELHTQICSTIDPTVLEDLKIRTHTVMARVSHAFGGVTTLARQISELRRRCEKPD